MSLLRSLWRGFVRLFGLDTCPVPKASVTAPETAEQRARRIRAQRVMRHL
jgi:hypothetical protein